MSTSVSMYNHVQTTPTCCCGIVAPSCVSTRAIFERWLRVNKCSSTRALPTHRVPTPHASCTVGVGCQAETALCLHAGGCRHPDWAHGFPAADAVLSFFGRQLCERHSGRRDDPVEGADADVSHTDACKCARGRSGVHCLQQHTTRSPPSA